jgi:hypothetical protein
VATAILDVDGTLDDTNHQHAIAWYSAFSDHGTGRSAVFESRVELPRPFSAKRPCADAYFLRLTAASSCRLFMCERPLMFRRLAWL